MNSANNGAAPKKVSNPKSVFDRIRGRQVQLRVADPTVEMPEPIQGVRCVSADPETIAVVKHTETRTETYELEIPSGYTIPKPHAKGFHSIDPAVQDSPEAVKEKLTAEIEPYSPAPFDAPDESFDPIHNLDLQDPASVAEPMKSAVDAFHRIDVPTDDAQTDGALTRPHTAELVQHLQQKENTLTEKEAEHAVRVWNWEQEELKRVKRIEERERHLESREEDIRGLQMELFQLQNELIATQLSTRDLVRGLKNPPHSTDHQMDTLKQLQFELGQRFDHVTVKWQNLFDQMHELANQFSEQVDSLDQPNQIEL